MNDLISRQAAIDALDVLCQEHRYKIPGKAETYSQYNEAWQDALDRAEGAIGNLPPVQPKRGKWIHGERRKFIDLANADEQYKTLGYPHRPYVNMTCSCCRMITIADETILYNYCPHCGADMRGGQDEESRSKSNAQTDTRARAMGTTDKSSGI